LDENSIFMQNDSVKHHLLFVLRGIFIQEYRQRISNPKPLHWDLFKDNVKILSLPGQIFKFHKATVVCSRLDGI
jgi:hypothetical protein